MHSNSSYTLRYNKARHHSIDKTSFLGVPIKPFIMKYSKTQGNTEDKNKSSPCPIGNIEILTEVIVISPFQCFVRLTRHFSTRHSSIVDECLSDEWHVMHHVWKILISSGSNFEPFSSEIVLIERVVCITK